MGETITGNLNRPPEPPKVNSNPGTAAGSTPGRQTRGNSPAPGTGTGSTPAPGGSGSTGGKTAGTAEKEKLSGLAPVTPPPVPDTPKKKQRKPRQPKKQEPASFNADQISALIVSLSSVVATRPGLEMFAITDVEARQIATPLANMIAKSEQLKALSEHTDAIALVTACFVIMAPRLMLYFNTQKEKKLKAAGGARLVRTDNEKTKTDGDNRKPVGHTADAVSYDVSPLFAAIPAIGE